MKSINVIWFPARFEAKVLTQTSRWLGKLSPISRLEVMSNMIHFANWIQSPEGLEYTKKSRSQWEEVFTYLMPYKEIGDTVGSAIQGKLFNGKTGMIGGLPFGFVVNIMQDLSLIGEGEGKNPITGKIAPKTTPKKIVSEASVITIVEDFLIHILPSLPVYTWFGGTVEPWRNTIKSWTEGAISAGESLVTGEPAKKINKRIKKEFKNVKADYVRYKQ